MGNLFSDPRPALPLVSSPPSRSGERHFCSLHDRAGREGGLIAAAAALIAIEPPAIDESMPRAIAARTAESIRSASLL